MPRGRPEAITPAKRKDIAELIFLGFTDQQISLMTEISDRTIRKARLGNLFPDIPRAALRREATYRRQIWDGKLGWQGAAWMLERRYPGQFCSPQIALQVNNTIGPQTQNVVILSNKSSIEVATRHKMLEAEVLEMLNLPNGNGTRPANGEPADTAS